MAKTIEYMPNASYVLSTYADHGVFFDCAVSAQRNERSRDHLRALAQRVEVVDPSEIRVLGTELLRTLVAAAGAESAAGGVRSFIPKWRAGKDSNLSPRMRGARAKCGAREAHDRPAPRMTW
jgi:hypothetical protein